MSNTFGHICEIKKRKMSEFELEMLPDEVLLRVLRYLPTKDLIGCRQVSKRIRAISHDKSLLELDLLPGEIILKVLSYLTIKDVISCGQVSSRIRVISQDESLWQKMNLYNKKVPAGFLKMVINKGCKYLSLSFIKLIGFTKLNTKCKLRYLNVSCRMVSDRIVKEREELLASCHSLQKLSMERLPITLDMIKNIGYQNGSTLQILNLFSCEGLTLESVQLIVDNCVDLSEVNFFATDLGQDSVNYLSNNLTPKIRKLNLSHLKAVRDENIEDLTTRCNKLTALDLAQTSITNICLIFIIRNLKFTLEQLDISDTSVNYDGIVELKSMQKLQVLNHFTVFNSMRDEDEAKLLSLFQHLAFNDESIVIATAFKDLLLKDGFWEIESKQVPMFKCVISALSV